MPINSITQTISTLPEAGHRGVDVQTQFVIKQEDFQDHLQGTTVTELNTLKDQLNSRIGEINSTTTTMNGYANTASAGASTATTKAGEASISASDALSYKNQAETFKNNASASATKASQWADNNYNVEVETGKYSAKHWSTVAQNATANKVDKVTSTDNAIVRFDGVTGQVQNSSIIIDDNGNVGIGTSSPISRLNIVTTGITPTAIKQGAYNTVSNSDSIVAVSENLGSSGDGNLTFGGRFGASFRGSGTGGISSGTSIGYYAFGGQYGNDDTYQPTKNLYAASIVGIAENVFSSTTNMPTAISFRTGSVGKSLDTVNTTYGTERMRIDSAGKVSIGTGGNSSYGLLGVNGQLGVNCSSLDVISARGLQFFIDGNKHGNLSVDNYDNLLYIGNGIGYGTGAGGTVTQLTSKSTTVTLNKPTGQIIMNNAALAAGTEVEFVFYNSLIGYNDNIYITVVSNGNYKVKNTSGSLGFTYVRVKNETAGSLSDAVQLIFSLIKGANS